MDREIINFYLDIVQELIDRGVPATIANINKHLAPANKEADIVEALDKLVSEGRLVKHATPGAAPDTEDYQIKR